MLPRRLAAALAVAVASVVALGTSASADTTLDRRIAPASGTGYLKLQAVKGEKYQVREGGSANARKGRAGDRRSLLLFAQLTDPQIADEMSPARVDFADSAGGEIKSSWRPQEAMGLQVFDQTVRAVNANRRSPVKQGNDKRAKLGLAITTGDLADNQQLNETEWFRTVLDGGVVDPFSGRADQHHQPVRRRHAGAGQRAQRRRRRPRVHGRAGLRRLRRRARRPQGGLLGSRRRPGGRPVRRLPALPRPDGARPGAVRRRRARRAVVHLARQPRRADPGQRGGQHRSLPGDRHRLPEGAPERRIRPRPRSWAPPTTSCSPPSAIRPSSDAAGQRPAGPARPRAADHLQGRVPEGHRHRPQARLRLQPKAQLDDSEGTASYYAFTRKGVRFISLDTVAEGGGQSGNLDDPQYRWLRAELKRARKNDELAVAFGHHTLGTMDNTRNDEQAGECQPADEPGCDRDPRRSTPLHRGTKGKKTVKALFAIPEPDRVRGRPHARQRGQFNKGKKGRGFWEINTASHIDWPQQSRLIEIMDNRDGTLSLFGTLLDHAARVAEPAPGPASALTRPARLAVAHAVVQRPAARGARGHRG